MFRLTSTILVFIIIICSSAKACDPSSLPHVLVIGDSISIGIIDKMTNTQGYFLYSQQYLKGEAILTHNEGNAAYSAHTLHDVDRFLSVTPPPDLITWNNGLHDISDLDLGHRRAEIPEYQNNLRAIGKKLLASGARVIFFTTTNVPPHEKHRREADVVAYNAAARAVMRELGIPVYDLGGLSEMDPGDHSSPADGPCASSSGERARQMRSPLSACGRRECAKPGSRVSAVQMELAPRHRVSWRTSP
jgi:lysophospholipase L1-like esterase